MNERTNRIYIANGVTIVAVNGSTNKVINTIQTLGDVGTLGVNPISNRIYAPDSNGRDILVINGQTNELEDRIKNLMFPSLVVVNPKKNRIFVATIGGPTPTQPSRLAVINGRLNKVIKNLRIGVGSTAGVVNTSNNNVYIVNQISNDVSVVAPTIKITNCQKVKGANNNSNR